MRRPTGVAIASATILASSTMLAVPAQAATCLEDVACATTTTFDVTAGALQVTVPDTADLANDAAPGAYAYGQLGTVTVDDLRASATPTWTATVDITTSFSTGDGADPGETIPDADVYYFSGDATATTGDGTFTSGQPGTYTPAVPPALPDGDPLDTTVTAFSHTGGTGNNSTTWNPYLTLVTALSNVAGQYSGVVTHTVS